MPEELMLFLFLFSFSRVKVPYISSENVTIKARRSPVAKKPLYSLHLYQ